MSTTERLPGHRVLAAGGKLSFEGDEQRLALEAEGVEFLTIGQLDLSRYQVRSE
jgi:methylated-DNA-protein-cysteine methyltransferase-like protein